MTTTERIKCDFPGCVSGYIEGIYCHVGDSQVRLGYQRCRQCGGDGILVIKKIRRHLKAEWPTVQEIMSRFDKLIHDLGSEQ